MTQAETGQAIGKRIRALRGGETQARFAEKIGVTRAALANYETGRTVPNDLIVLKIANITGVSPSSIVSEEVYSFDDLAALMAAKPELKNMEDLSNDERSFIRLMRVCDDEAFAQAAGIILDSIKEDRVMKEAMDIVNFEADFTRLATIRAGGARYVRGFTRDTLKTIMQAINERVSKKADEE